MAKLINADDFSKVIQDYFKDCIEHKKYEVDVVDCNADIQKLLSQQAAAYNVEKVIEEIKGIRLPLASQTVRICRIVKRGGADETEEEA